MAHWLSTIRWRSLLRYRLRSLLVMVAFAAVLLGWWCDHRRMEERIRRKNDLLGVLRTTARRYFEEEDWLVEDLSSILQATKTTARIDFESAAAFLAWVRAGVKWNPQWEVTETRQDAGVQIILPQDQWPDAVRGLFAILKEDNLQTRYCAVCTLRTLNDLPYSVVLELVAATGATGAEEEFARSEAVRLLRVIVKNLPPSGPERPEIVATFRDMLKDNDAQRRIAAAKLLSELEPTPAILDELILAFNDEADVKVRRVIARAIEILHEKGAE